MSSPPYTQSLSQQDAYDNHVKVNEYKNEYIVNSVDYTKNVFKEPVPRTLTYVKNLFPFIDWIPHYPFHLNWLISDFITGVTVAIVLVPQSMSYAKLAGLSPEFGLYSGFVGLVFYFLFATSREICIGPVAVLSMEVGKIITRVQNKYPGEYSGPEIATTLALICGGIVMGIGLLRLGFIVEFISLPAILAFTTGSAFSIVTGQLAGLMGFKKKAGKHDATYKTMIAFLKHLPDTTVDAAFGLVCLFVLTVWQLFAEYMIKRTKNDKRKNMMWIYILNLRFAVVIILSTCISFGVIRHKPRVAADYPFSVIGVIPSGLKHVGRFIPPAGIASKIASELPICTIVLVLEHISISKSFARLNGYRVNPNQEFVAIGFTNLIGTFFGAYPATGSFSRTALSAKCGVKTPVKAAFSGICVLLAIYEFTDAFYYIPNAALSAIIIHCVIGLLASYKITTKLYMFSPIDFFIFIIGVFIAVFSTIENGIYFAICASCAQALWRLCIPNGAFLGRVRVGKVRDPILVSNSYNEKLSEASGSDVSVTMDDCIKSANNEYTRSINNDGYVYRWVPLPKDEYNPSKIHARFVNGQINIEQPPTGVLVYRFTESFIYTNCSYQIDQIIQKVRETYRPFNTDRERLWCEYKWHELDWSKFGKVSKYFKRKHISEEEQLETIDNDQDFQARRKAFDQSKPKLRVLHLDFSQVIGIDATSIQALIDLQFSINNHVGTDWELHFSGIINPWVLRGLIHGGFGKPNDQVDRLHSENMYIAQATKDSFLNKLIPFNKKSDDEGEDIENIKHENFFNGELEIGINENGAMYPLYSTEYPYFHFDIPNYSDYTD